MRALGVLMAVVAAGTLFVGAPNQAFAQTQKPGFSEQDKGNADFDMGKFFKRLHGGRPSARRVFTPGKPGEKVSGSCSIDCGNGDGTIVWAFDVGDCACQCASYCGSDCFAWEVANPENNAYCPAY
jgi:hypothetical protein